MTVLTPGTYSLAALQITTPLTGQVQTTTDGLEGMSAVTVECVFAYGSGGTSLSALMQTSLDEGVTWRDVVRFDFTTSSDVRYSNLSGLTPKSNVAYLALAAAGVNDGLLGDQLRAVITSVGTYVNTTVGIHAAVR
jgi:hypothetical protein